MGWLLPDGCFGIRKAIGSAIFSSCSSVTTVVVPTRDQICFGPLMQSCFSMGPITLASQRDHTGSWWMDQWDRVSLLLWTVELRDLAMNFDGLGWCLVIDLKSGGCDFGGWIWLCRMWNIVADLGLSCKSLGCCYYCWWRVVGQLSCSLYFQGCLKKRGPLQFNFMRESGLAFFIPIVKVVGDPVLIVEGMEMVCCWFCLSLFRIFVLVLIVCLGLICPYSFELGLGSIVVPWLWRYSRGLIASILVCFCCQYADIQSLHVVWYFLGRGVEEGVVFLAIAYEVLSGLSRLFFISSQRGRFLWFEVGPFWLIWIVLNNLHVTNIISRVVRGSLTIRVVGRRDITACHSHVL